MGYNHWYACLDCKRYIDLWCELPVVPISGINRLSWDDIQVYKEWIEQGEDYPGIDLEFGKDILGWLTQHWNHNIIYIGDADWIQVWENYLGGLPKNNPKWKEEFRAKTSPMYINHRRRWE